MFLPIAMQLYIEWGGYVWWEKLGLYFIFLEENDRSSV